MEIQEECLKDKGAPKQKQEELKDMITRLRHSNFIWFLLNEQGVHESIMMFDSSFQTIGKLH
jgi:hypothetical protein